MKRQVRIHRRTGTVRVAPRGVPVLNIAIGAREKVVSCTFEKEIITNFKRKTRDWTYTLITEEQR